MASEGNQENDAVEEKEPKSAVDTLQSILDRSDRILRGSQRGDIIAAQEGEAEPDDGGLPILEECWSDLRGELESLGESIGKEIEGYPMMRLSMKVVEKLIDEYRRLDLQIDTLTDELEAATGARANQERSRIRDNVTQLVIERWRLLNAIQDNIHKVFNALLKAKDKEGSMDDPFAQFDDVANQPEEDGKDEPKGAE